MLCMYSTARESASASPPVISGGWTIGQGFDREAFWLQPSKLSPSTTNSLCLNDPIDSELRPGWDFKVIPQGRPSRLLQTAVRLA